MVKLLYPGFVRGIGCVHTMTLGYENCLRKFMKWAIR